jgi:hypothetical protein
MEDRKFNFSQEYKADLAKELTLKFLERNQMVISDASPEGTGKAVANLFNAILENLNL